MRGGVSLSEPDAVSGDLKMTMTLGVAEALSSDKGGGGVIIPVTHTPLDPPLDKNPNQKIVPVPLLLNLYLPIELRASYLMRSALLSTYCSSGGIPGLACLTYK